MSHADRATAISTAQKVLNGASRFMSMANQRFAAQSGRRREAEKQLLMLRHITDPLLCASLKCHRESEILSPALGSRDRQHNSHGVPEDSHVPEERIVFHLARRHLRRPDLPRGGVDLELELVSVQ